MSHPDPERATRELTAINWCLDVLAKQGISSKAEIARRLPARYSASAVAKYLNRERGLSPEFVRDLAVLARLPVAEVFGALGWLPAEELPRTVLTDLAHDAVSALRALAAVPDLASFVRPAPPAPTAAAQALLSDEAGRERFSVLLTQVVSGRRYRTATNLVGEFALRPGARPLAAEKVTRLALEAGFDQVPDLSDEHAAVRWELLARTANALSDGQEYSWQGGAGHLTWRTAATGWPSHLLVQDSVAGQQRPSTGMPLTWPQARTVVVIGGRESAGPAAALLAEALDWQFVLIRPNVEVTPGGRVRTYPSDLTRSRTHTWIHVARHIQHRGDQGVPWHTVVLLRPDALTSPGGTIHPYAAELLERTPASVVYVRPTGEHLSWWATRNAGNHDHGRYDTERAVNRLRTLYASIEEILRRRDGARDLLLRLPRPARALAPHTPELPGEVMDQTARVAWTAARWLSREGRADPLRPGALSGWRRLLAADPDAAVPRLTRPGR